MIDLWILFSGVVIFSAVLRLLPHLLAPYGAGVDHWYWKAYVDEYRSTGVFPPLLPQFILESKQWYPPLFPLMVAKLPEILFERYSHILAIVIDLVRLILVMTSAYLITGRVNSMVAAGLAYSLTPILISYNIQLNPRGLAALFLDIIILLLIWLIWHDGMAIGWVLIAIVSGLMLLTHKMTTQLFWFLSISTAIVFMDWRLLMLVPLSVVSALVLSRGFYLNVLRHHWDIVTFWNRNWRWLSAHPVLESPLYGDPGFETPTKYFRTGLRGIFRRIQYIVGFNPWAWAIFIASLWVFGLDANLTEEDIWMTQWLGLVLLFIILTTIVPFMRCIGNGYLYSYNAAFPAALLIAMIWGGLNHDQVVNIILAVTLLACIISILYYFWVLKHSKTLKVDAEMDNVLHYLDKLPYGVVMCFPQHWHDLVAYKAHKPVLYGAHGFGFKMIEPVFPRLLKPVSEIISDYKVRYLLTIEGYLPERFLKELPQHTVRTFGDYRLYSLE